MAAAACGDAAALQAILDRYPAREPSLIPILQDIQRAYGYLPCEGLRHVAEALHVPLARVFSAATFYRAFALTPQGKTVVKVCTGTACHLRGAGRLLDDLGRRLHVAPGETTADLGLTLQTVNCVGACAMAPVVIVGARYLGHAAPGRLARLLDGAGAR
ncbi:MAG: NAD(P)H-dependent oxidoreductase subunit E [Candidatus Methylomirabilales bacterium]